MRLLHSLIFILQIILGALAVYLLLMGLWHTMHGDTRIKHITGPVLFTALFLWQLKKVYPDITTRLVKRMHLREVYNQNFLLGVFAIVIPLLGAEAYARAQPKYESYGEANGGRYISPYYLQRSKSGWLYSYKPNKPWSFTKPEFAYTIHPNSLGMVDVEWKTQSDSAQRLACFGDSFTEGVGASNDSCYPRLLQKLLPHTQVMNCGISGSDPLYGFMALKKNIQSYHPNIATLTINSTDPGDVITRGGLERFLPNGTVRYNSAPWWEPFFAVSYIVRMVTIGALHYDFFLLSPRQSREEHARALQKINQGIDAFESFCRQNNIRPLLVFHPMMVEIEENKMICAPVLQHVKQKGYAYVNVADYFKAHGVTAQNINAYYWPIDKHLNNRGYALMATAIAENIESIK